MKQRGREESSLFGRLFPVTGRPGVRLFLFFLAFYYLTNAGWHKIGDENAVLMVARQIAMKGQVGFDSKMAPEDPYGDIVQGVNRLFYFKWSLGQSLVETPLIFIHHVLWSFIHSDHSGQSVSPAYNASEFLFLIFGPSAISAFGCLLLFWLALRLGFAQATGVLLALIYGLGTMIWPYSKSFMSETTLNVALLGGVYAVVSYTVTRQRWWLVLSGACVGFSVLTKPMALVVVPVLLLYLFAKVGPSRAARDIGTFWMIPFMVFLVVQGWHNTIRYGNFMEFGYGQGWDRFGFCTPLYVGLWGLFLSPGKSFFLYTPAAALSLTSAKMFFKDRKQEACLFLGICVVYVLPHALWCLWAGDWAWGPRFLLVITPYLILPVGWVLTGWIEKRRLTRIILGGVLVASVAVQVLGVAIHPFAFIEIRTDVTSPLMNPQIPDVTYARSYAENALISFSPMFSHLVGNWWLLKHMVFVYPFQDDAPWRALGVFELDLSKYVQKNRIIPFSWIVTLPAISPSLKTWVYGLAGIVLLTTLWSGIGLRRFFAATMYERV
jgi:hypothetical protein